MIDLRQVNIHEMKRAVSALIEHLGNPVRKDMTIGLTKVELVKFFSYEIEHLPEEDQNELPEYVQEMYNFLYQDEDVEGKKFKPKYLKRINKWGSIEGTQAYVIDQMIWEGGFTLEEMARAACTNKARVRRHLHGRKEKFNIHFVVYNRRYYMKENEDNREFQENKRVVREFTF